MTKSIFTTLLIALMSLSIKAQTVVDIIVNSSDHDTLEAAVVAAGLLDDLSGNGPFTVFAPTDDAFRNLPAGVLNTLLSDPTGDLARILLYHVLSGDVRSNTLSDGQTATMLLGQDISISVNMNGVFINNARVTLADQVATNGVVHVLDAVLLPPAETVADVVINSTAHDTLEAALSAAGLVPTLQGDGPFTVFAPTDDAFRNLPAGTIPALLADPTGNLAKILLQHVVAGEVLAGDLSDGQVVRTLLGQNIEVTIDNNGVFIDDAQVTVTDIRTYNGVVHVLDAVLLPPAETVADVVINSTAHDTLEAALSAAGLVPTLQGDGPFTVFAPTDDAFRNLPAGTIPALLADPTGNLAKILLQHVVAGEVLAGDLSDGQVVRTLLGQNIEVTIDNNGVFIDDAQVTVTDIRTYNGVVHVLDAVLLPPAETVADVVINSTAHDTLEAALSAAGLVPTLQGDGPFTVFAPTDDAFRNLPAGTIPALLADPTGNLARILLQHVVAGEVLAGDLSDGQIVRTLLGQNIEVTIDNNGVFIDDAQVTVTDIRTYNGVVHVLDAVLLPPAETVADVVINSTAHDTLEAALSAAGLVPTLQGDGPFTVFAPTDDAFRNLPAGTIPTLLADPTGNLARILLQHVVAGEVLAGDLSDGQVVRTLLGQNIEVTIDNNGVFIDDAQVTVTDIRTYNGVVHVLDAVLLPPAETVADVVINSMAHDTLEAALSAAGLVPTLQGDGPFTVFAPTDDAFRNLPAGTIPALLADPMGDLTEILQYHVLNGEVLSETLTDGQTATTLQGQDITVTLSNNSVLINDAVVTLADIRTYNGVVHVIDAVLLPDLSSSVNNLEEIQMQVMPNPSSDYVQLTIPVEFLQEKVEAQLISLDGKVLRNWTVRDATERIDVRNLTPGAYVLLLTSIDRFSKNTLIVK